MRILDILDRKYFEWEKRKFLKESSTNPLMAWHRFFRLMNSCGINSKRLLIKQDILDSVPVAVRNAADAGDSVNARAIFDRALNVCSADPDMAAVQRKILKDVPDLVRHVTVSSSRKAGDIFVRALDSCVGKTSFADEKKAILNVTPDFVSICFYNGKPEVAVGAIERAFEACEKNPDLTEQKERLLKTSFRILSSNSLNSYFQHARLLQVCLKAGLKDEVFSEGDKQKLIHLTCGRIGNIAVNIPNILPEFLACAFSLCRKGKEAEENSMKLFSEAARYLPPLIFEDPGAASKVVHVLEIKMKAPDEVFKNACGYGRDRLGNPILVGISGLGPQREMTFMTAHREGDLVFRNAEFCCTAKELIEYSRRIHGGGSPNDRFFREFVGAMQEASACLLPSFPLEVVMRLRVTKAKQGVPMPG